MKTIDLHCDTLMKAFIENGEKGEVYDCPEYSVDLKRLKQANAMAQFFAIFMLKEEDYAKYHVPAANYEEYMLGCVSVFENTMKEHEDIVARARNAKEILENEQNGKVSAILTMEDGVIVDGKMENIKRLYDLGIRALSLTWNYENCFGYPNSTEPERMKKGLKPFGKEAVAFMQELGMIVDVSHLSDGGYWDVMDVAQKPIMATHSNARSICNHPRNMTDEMIRALANNGGVMGINFCSAFLDGTPNNQLSRVDDMVQMALYESKVGGIDIVALGTDFDGIGGELEIKDPLAMDLLANGLAKAGFHESEIDKIFWKNALRVMYDTL